MIRKKQSSYTISRRRKQISLTIRKKGKNSHKNKEEESQCWGARVIVFVDFYPWMVLKSSCWGPPSLLFIFTYQSNYIFNHTNIVARNHELMTITKLYENTQFVQNLQGCMEGCQNCMKKYMTKTY